MCLMYLSDVCSSVAKCGLCPVKVRDDILGNEVQLMPMQSEIDSLNQAMAVLIESVTRAGSTMVARHATLAIQRAIAAANLGETRSSEPFRPLPGDNSLKRKDPAILEGLPKKKKQGGALPKFIPNKKPGKKGSGRSLSDQLQASKDHPVSATTSAQASCASLLPTDVAKKKASTRGVSRKKRHRLGVPVSPANKTASEKGVSSKKGRQLSEPTSSAASSPHRSIEMLNSDNRCYLCGAMQGSYKHRCCKCLERICSLGLAVQNDCPVMESPSGDGVCCTACSEKKQ